MQRKWTMMLLIIFNILLCIVLCFNIFFLTKREDKNYSNAPIDNMTLIEIPNICQYPTLPTGCEVTAATMVLQFYGEKISIESFARNWLVCDDRFYQANNMLYGPDPHKVFVGSPFTKSSYGCYAMPIVNAINSNSSVCKAELITAKDIKELCDLFIDNNKPVIIWATMGMKPSEDGSKWHSETKQEIVWKAGEHSLVLVGYDDKHYFLVDPQSGSVVGYEKHIVEKRFSELGMQAILVRKK